MNRDFYDTLLISVQEIKEESLINQNVDDKTISSILDTAQEIYLSEIIGTPLYRRLQELVYNKIKGLQGDKIDGTGFEVYNELLEEYVKPYLKYKTMENFIVENSFKLRNIGVVRNLDTNVNYVDLDQIRFVQKHYASYVAKYEDRISKFLCVHSKDMPEVTAEIAPYLDEPKPGETYSNTGGLWLGGIKNNGCKSCKN